MGLQRSRMVGTRWNKVGTGYGPFGWTTKTPLLHYLTSNLVPRRSQIGSKWPKNAILRSNWTVVAQNGWNKVEQGWNRV